jgi:hypothetical protein
MIIEIILALEIFFIVFAIGYGLAGLISYFQRIKRLLESINEGIKT